MTSAHLDLSARSPGRTMPVVTAAPNDLRLLWRARNSSLLLFAVLASAVVASPFLLGATFASGWSMFWQLTWLGFDLAVAGALIVAAVGALRHSPWSEGSAAVAASLLACNAAVDVTTAPDARHMILAGITAVTVEVPLMALCLMIACPREPAALRASAAGSSS